ncbi:MAG TPA: glycosyltransferase family 87 protein [Terracidiphilus sp.]|nr:glycosyltransferase family 87 protein [Terracidiphilus sp.]
MTKVRRNCLLVVLLSGAISVLWGFSIGRKDSGGPTDFQAVYYGARCLLQHHNPYSVREMEGVYRAAGEESPSPTLRQRQLVTLYVNLPTTFLLIAPLEMFPLGMAQVLWMLLTAGGLILAALLMWNLGEKYAPVLSACLIAFLLANCEFVFFTGNTAGIVVGFGVVAAWCFLQERFVLAGILCMAVSLAIKPHDAGLVWLYFLLAGGVHRKRALQTLAVTAVLALSAILWVSHVAPHWMQDWHSNMTFISARGGINDPGPTAVAADNFARVISLQAAFSIFRDDPQFYNLATYLVCGPLLLVWLVTTLRSRSSQDRALLALAAIVPLTILVTYHRVYDAKLVLLTVPACAMLWATGGPIRWIALVLNTAGVVLCSDAPMIVLDGLARSLHLSTSVWSGQILTVVLDRPTTDILLIMGIFYLWVYVRSVFYPSSCKGSGTSKQEHSAPAIA